MLVERPVKLQHAPLFLLQFYRHVCATSVIDSDYHPRLKLFLHELLFNFWGVIEGSDVVDILFVLDGNRLGSHGDNISLKIIRLEAYVRQKPSWRGLPGERKTKGNRQCKKIFDDR